MVGKKNMGIGNLNPNDKAGKPTPPAEPNPTPAPETPAEPTPTQEPTPPADPAKHDGTDVESALQRTTQDGKGDEEVPPADFKSFATEGVELTDEEKGGTPEDQINNEDIARQVLAGKWGAGDEKRERLEKAGFDPTAIARIVNQHLASGAPHVFPTSVRDDATAVIRGEWGDEEDQIKRNLKTAGKDAEAVWAERTKNLGQ